MRNLNFRVLLSALCVASVLASFAKVNAAPIRFDQVVQVVNARPDRADSGMFARLTVAGNYSFLISDGDDDEDKKKPAKPQDGRVITETKTDIVTDDVCDCEEEIVTKRGFPKWALLGLAAIPIAFILIKRKKDTPTPTPPPPPPTGSPTPSPTTTPSPSTTPTPSPSKTPTPTPSVTPTPTPPEPVPEPMTILLFGTGLASIGLAARRKFGKKGDKSEESGDE
ncbi:MAG: PEP-CTERM sorting domain-containing protein [Pyrinomonadaceae bacterium]